MRRTWSSCDTLRWCSCGARPRGRRARRACRPRARSRRADAHRRGRGRARLVELALAPVHVGRALVHARISASSACTAISVPGPVHALRSVQVPSPRPSCHARRMRAAPSPGAAAPLRAPPAARPRRGRAPRAPRRSALEVEVRELRDTILDHAPRRIKGAPRREQRLERAGGLVGQRFGQRFERPDPPRSTRAENSSAYTGSRNDPGARARRSPRSARPGAALASTRYAPSRASSRRTGAAAACPQLHLLAALAGPARSPRPAPRGLPRAVGRHRARRVVGTWPPGRPRCRLPAPRADGGVPPMPRRGSSTSRTTVARSTPASSLRRPT